MIQKSPVNLKDDIKFNTTLSLISAILFFLSLYQKQYYFAIIGLIMVVLFVIKTELNAMQRHNNKQYEELLYSINSKR